MGKKLKKFTDEHPVITVFGTFAIIAVVSYSIGHRVGYVKGYNNGTDDVISSIFTF